MLNCVFRNFRKTILIMVFQFYQVGEVLVKRSTSEEQVFIFVVVTTRVLVKKLTIFKIFEVWSVMGKSVEAKTSYLVANVHYFVAYVHSKEYADLNDLGAQA